MDRAKESDNHHEMVQIEIHSSIEAANGKPAAMPAPYHPMGKAVINGATQ
jgi:hypothetical protein